MLVFDFAEVTFFVDVFIVDIPPQLTSNLANTNAAGDRRLMRWNPIDEPYRDRDVIIYRRNKR